MLPWSAAVSSCGHSEDQRECLATARMRECFLRGSPGVAEGLQSHPLTGPNGPRLLSSGLAPASVTWLKALLVVWTCRGTSLGALEPLDQLTAGSILSFGSHIVEVKTSRAGVGLPANCCMGGSFLSAK